MADDDVPATSRKEERSLSWERLPDDVWELIFTKLDGGGKPLKFISLVCKGFLSISNRARTSVYISDENRCMPLQAPRFYSRFPFIKSITLMDVIDPNILDATITQLAYSTTPLESLTLFDQVRFPKKAMRILGQRMNKTLRSLSCLFFQVTTDDDLAVVADCFSYLHEFDIKSSGYSVVSARGSKSKHVTDKGIWLISTKLKSLVSLGIANRKRISHQSLEYLASNCPSLRKLSAGVSIDDPSNSSSIRLDQFKRLDFFGSLSSLGLSGVKMSKDVLLQLTEQNLKVEELQLNNLRFTDDITGAMFCEFLKSCSSLEQLKLESLSYPANTRAVDIADAIPGIQLIHLSDSYLKFLPSKILLYLFMRCPLLEDVDFRDNLFGIGQEWFEASPTTSVVRKLSFSCEDLCDESLKAVLSICPKLEELSIFSFLNRRVTLVGVKAAVTNCPKMKHLYFNDDDLAVVADCFSYLHEFDINSSGYSVFSARGSKSKHVTDKGIWLISTKLKSLVSLGIANQKRIAHQSLEYLATNCPSLRKLSAGVSTDDPYNRSSICLDQFKRSDFFCSLSSLGLSGVEISKDVLIQLTEQNLKVEELQLNNLRFRYDITGPMFCEFLKSCRSLDQLKLESLSYPSNTREVDIADAIPSIRVIELRDSYLKFLPSEILFYLFMRCPLLEDVDFHDDCLGIGQEWFEASPPTSLVRKLSFCCEDLCDETLKAVLTICPKLEELSIFLSRRVTLEGVKAAVTNCPNIKHLYVNDPIDLADFRKAK